MASVPSLSVIVPALDEAQGISATLESIAPVRAHDGEIIVVDGGSRDPTAEIAGRHADRVIGSEPGRARQMNAGAAIARGDMLWFLHADTRVDVSALENLHRVCRDPDVLWGRFGVRLDSRRPILRLTAFLMNRRSCLTGIATGDQGIFVRADLFRELGGFPLLPLMEDVELSRRLRRRARPCCLPAGLTTSARRWEQNGAWSTILLMWRLRLAYWRGADPAMLAARYRRRRA
jgi:rSAM/selenodomain-associated transferase 2